LIYWCWRRSEPISELWIEAYHGEGVRGLAEIVVTHLLHEPASCDIVLHNLAWVIYVCCMLA
jgi:hypothetical protein